MLLFCTCHSSIIPVDLELGASHLRCLVFCTKNKWQITCVPAFFPLDKIFHISILLSSSFDMLFSVTEIAIVSAKREGLREIAIKMRLDNKFAMKSGGVMAMFAFWLSAVLQCVSGEVPASQRTEILKDNSDFVVPKPSEEREISENFVLTDKLTDGEFERRIHFNGLKGKETSLTPEVGKSPITLWQLTNGQTFYQIIFNNGYAQMVDCEVVKQRDLIEDFIRKFNKEVHILVQRNASSHLHHHQYRMPHVSEHEFNDFMRNEKMPFNYEMSSLDNDEEFDDINRIIRRDQVYFSRSVSYEQLSDYKDLPSELIELLNFKTIQSQCDELTQRMQDIAHGLESDNEVHRNNATEKLNRHRRDLQSMFLVRGTKWCGRGNMVTKYTDMGGHSKADRCCRQHDKFCPFWIMGFQTKYGLFNWRINTLMHCKCDERFRTCLKMADSPDANLVGNLFFNIVQTKCFVLKPEKYCKKYNVFKLKCENKGVRKRAILRDNRKF